MTIATWILIALFTIAGTLSTGASIANATWLFGTPRPQHHTRRTIMRILYGIAGLGILAMALHLALWL